MIVLETHLVKDFLFIWAATDSNLLSIKWPLDGDNQPRMKRHKKKVREWRRVCENYQLIKHSGEGINEFLIADSNKRWI